MRRKRQPTAQEMADYQRAKIRYQRRATFNDVLSNVIVFGMILLIVALVLSQTSCVVAAPQTVDPSFQGMAAQATVTRAAYNVSLTQAAATVQAANVATGTAVSVNSTVQSAQATATIGAQETAVVQATATSYQRSQEAIALEAQATRTKLETDATATAVALAVQYGIDKANRAYWFWIGLLFIVVTALAGIGYAAIKILLRNAATVRDRDGNVVFFRGVSLLPDVSDVPQLQRGGHMTTNSGNRARGVDRNRPGKTLFDTMGREVYTFTGRQLDKLENNITVNQDMGFRRNDSNNGYGLDGLLGIKNNDLYGRIAMAMKHAGYLKDARGGLVWADKGMTDFLEMNLRPAPPHSGTLAYH